MIKKNSVVSMSYCLKNEQGTELDRADKSSPFISPLFGDFER